MVDNRVTDGSRQPDEPNFGRSGSLLNAKDESDWDIPALTFPSIDDTDASSAQTAALSFPKVDGIGTGTDAMGAAPAADTGAIPARSAVPAAGSVPTPRSAAPEEPADVTARGVSAWQADHPTFSSPLAQSTVRKPPVPAPQTTSASETTVLPPLGADASGEDSKAALESQATAVITPNLLGAVADADHAGTGFRSIIEGTSDRITPSAEADDSESGTAGAGDGGDGEEATAAAQPPISPRKKFLIGLGAIAVIAAVAGITAFSYIQRTGNEARLQSALTACKAAADDATKAKDSLSAALKKAQDAQQTTADQVADATTLTKLADAIDAVQDSATTHACTGTLPASQLETHAQENAKLAGTFKSSTKSLESAVKAVTDSQAKKEEADAAQVRQELQQAVADAQTLLTNSEGAVADDATRQTLQTAVDTANALLGESTAKAADLRKALDDVKNASTAVNESMNAYSTASQRTTSGSSGTRRRYNSANGGTTNSNRNQTTTTPGNQTTTPTTPGNQTTTPSTGDNGGQNTEGGDNGGSGNGDNNNQGNNGNTNGGQTSGGDNNNGNSTQGNEE